MSEFQLYRRRIKVSELRPYVDGEWMAGISISPEDAKVGSPKPGDMIARNPDNHDDKWLVAEKYFADNFDPEPEKYPLVNQSTVPGSAEPTAEQAAITLKQMHAILDAFNETPDGLKPTMAVSFFVSICMNATSPIKSFDLIAAHVREAIGGFIEQQGHH